MGQALVEGRRLGSEFLSVLVDGNLLLQHSAALLIEAMEIQVAKDILILVIQGSEKGLEGFELWAVIRRVELAALKSRVGTSPLLESESRVWVSVVEDLLGEHGAVAAVDLSALVHFIVRILLRRVFD